jgi:hypothetical protein
VPIGGGRTMLQHHAQVACFVHHSGAAVAHNFVEALEAAAKLGPRRRLSLRHRPLAALLAVWCVHPMTQAGNSLVAAQRRAQLKSVPRRVRVVFPPAQQLFVESLASSFERIRLPRELRDGDTAAVETVSTMLRQGYPAILVAGSEQRLVQALAVVGVAVEHWLVTRHTVDSATRHIAAMQGSERVVVVTLHPSLHSRHVLLLVFAASKSTSRLLLVFPPATLQLMRGVPANVPALWYRTGAVAGTVDNSPEWQWMPGHGGPAVAAVVENVSRAWGAMVRGRSERAEQRGGVCVAINPLSTAEVHGDLEWQSAEGHLRCVNGAPV